MFSLPASITSSDQKQPRNSGDTIFSIISLRADNSIVGGLIWPILELVDIMHVLDTYKFKRDWINSNREKVATSIFFDAQGQLTL